MATDSPPKVAPINDTTRRGFATASFSLALWGTVVFFWYPFGMILASLGVTFGVISLALGVRSGRHPGDNLAPLGILMGSIGVGLAIGVYRFVQFAFEGTVTGGLVQFPGW